MTETITELSAPGSSTVPNQDRAGHAGALAWVIDGATPLGPALTPGGDDAVWLADQLDAGLRAHAGCAETLPVLVRTVLTAVQAAYAPYHAAAPTDSLPPTAGLALVRWAETHVEYCLLGDCTATFIFPAPDPSITLIGSPLLSRLDRQALTAMADLQARELSLAEARAAIAPILTAHRRLANAPDGYAVCGPDPHAVDRAVVGTVARVSGMGVMLATDGFSRLWETLAVYPSAAATFAALQASSPAVLLTQLRAAEAADGDAVQYPRFKVHDDASVVVIEAL